MNVAAEAVTYKATGKSGERFLDCASRLLRGSEGERKKRRLAPLGMTVGVLWRDDRRKMMGEGFQGLKKLRVFGVLFMSRPACGRQANLICPGAWACACFDWHPGERAGA